jgi:hypothetical protein
MIVMIVKIRGEKERGGQEGADHTDAMGGDLSAANKKPASHQQYRTRAVEERIEQRQIGYCHYCLISR